MAVKRSFPWLTIIFLLLLIGGGAGGWYWYQQRNETPPPDYRTVTIARGDIIQSVTANGAINAVKTVQVGTQVSGIIKDIQVDFNSKVTNGQIVAKIDPSTYQQALVLSQADLANAQAALELATVTDKRNRELQANKLIPDADCDKSLADLHQAQAVVKMREAGLQTAKVDLDRCIIYAPINGIVISRNVDEGQTVASSFNTPTLFLIANDLTQMQIEAMVSEADVGGVEVGQKVNFTVDAFPNRQFPGVVNQVRYAPITNQNVVTYTCVVEVKNPELKLRPGMTATASIIIAERDDVVRIPNAALRFRPPEKAAPKVDPSAKGTNGVPAMAGGRTNASPEAKMAGGPGGTGERPSREEIRQRTQNMSPEERQAFFAQMRARYGDSGGSRGGGGGMPGGGGGGGGGRANQDGPATRTVYIIPAGAAKPADPKSGPELKPVTIKTGITDGSYTEVLEGLKDGDVVVSGLNQPVGGAAGARPGATPFGGPFGGPRRF